MKIAVILTARPSWAKLSTVCAALYKRPDVELQIIACASALLERYGKVVDVVRKEYPIAAECWTVHEGENLLTSAKETGTLLSELCSVLHRLRPDLCVVCADRHEVLGAAQAASYLHVPLVHLQGGEVTGSIDDKVRDSISQLADYHMVATTRAKHRVYGLTGDWERIYHVGCPSIDVAKQALSEPLVSAKELGGAGADIDVNRPFLLILQHGVTNEADDAFRQMRATMEACSKVPLPRVVMWPGEDAGAALISKAIRVWQADHPHETWHTVRNLPPNRFLRLLSQATVLVGNSSAGIREASYIGTPVVNIGTRQQGRERAPNVWDVPHEAGRIQVAIEEQRENGPYRQSNLYGSGDAGERIAEVLCSL